MSGKQSSPFPVLCGEGVPIGYDRANAAPEWVMVLPRGDNGVIATADGRGPYRVADFARLAAVSLQAAGGRLPLDETHATDLAAPKGQPAPARGWMVELQARDTGIWARVEWTGTGAALMSDRSYRFISPVFDADAKGNVLRLLRASLINTPNLRGMAALNSTETTTMDLLAKLAKALGLPETATEEEVMAKIRSLSAPANKVAMASELLAPIAAAVKLDAAKAVNVETIVGAITELASARTGDQQTVITALQTELATVSTKLNSVLQQNARERAEAYVDGAIAAKRVGVSALREHYIEQHQIDPARVEKEIGALPTLGMSGALNVPPETKDGKVQLNAEQIHVTNLLGIPHDDYAKTLAAERGA